MASEVPYLFVDTWGWLVLEDRKHPAHAETVRIRRRHTDSGGRLVTTDYVLDEMITRLFSRRPFPEASAVAVTHHVCSVATEVYHQLLGQDLHLLDDGAFSRRP